MSDRLEFRFLWNAAEHRRFYDVVRRAVARRGTTRWVYAGAFAFVAILAASQIRSNGDSAVGYAFAVAPYLIIAGLWLAFARWGMPHLSARAYERNHQACIPHDQVRVVSDDGIEARCVTSDVRMQWSGISRVLETPEFFLFFTTPNCAFQLPKRAIPNTEQLEALRQLAGRHTHVEQSPDVA